MKFRRQINYIWRGVFLILAVAPFFFYKEFIQAFQVYFTGGNRFRTILGQWHIVILNIAFFISFLIPLSFRRKIQWSEYGLVIAFFVSLFIEMYGIPLTILLAANFFRPKVLLPEPVAGFSFLGIRMSIGIPMIYGTILITIGTILIIIGWITLYRNIKRTNIVTRGIYSCSRHPQYLGFILIIIGWLFGWHTILTAILSPILIYKYVMICIIEEKELAKEIKEYSNYKKQVPFFF